MRSAHPSHDESLRRARRYEPAPLEAIHRAYYSEIYRYVHLRLRPVEACQEITAAVFGLLLDALSHKGGPQANLPAWLYQTARRLVDEYLLAAGRSRPAAREDERASSGPPEDDWHSQLIRNALHKLPPEMQHVLAVRFAQNRSLEETALRLGLPVEAAQAAEFQALAQLKRRLMDEEP